MRILCATGYYKPAYIYGGPVKSVATLCEGLARMGNQVTVFTTNANGPGRTLAVSSAQPQDVNGVRVFYYPISRARARIFPFYSPALGNACAASVADYDILYIPATWTYVMYAAGRHALRRGVPYIVSPRGSFMTWSMAQKALKKRIYLELVERRIVNAAAAIHCTSWLESEQLRRWGFRSKVAIIPNAIEAATFQEMPERGALRGKLAIPASATVSLYVGRLHKMKRIDLLVEGFARVARETGNAHLVVVGPDEDGTGLSAQARVADLGLSARVHFLGLLTGHDLLQAYRDADLLTLLSHRENFGMAAVEAMAAGLPVLLTQEVGLAEEITRAQAGYAVPAQPDQVAEVWVQMLNAPELRHEMGLSGKAIVRQKFELSMVASQMLKLFTDSVGGD